MADSSEKGEEWTEFKYIKTMELTVYADEFEVRM